MYYNLKFLFTVSFLINEIFNLLGYKLYYVIRQEPINVITT